MTKYVFTLAVLLTGVSAATFARAQVARDGAATLGRDIGLKANEQPPVKPPLPPIVQDKSDRASNAVDRTVFIGAVRVDGAEGIDMALFAPAIERFIGKTAGSSDLQELARAIANVARDQGFVFASASVPGQSVDTGTLVVKLDMGRVDRVRVAGSEDRRLLRILRKLEGRAVRRPLLENQLLLAGDVPGLQIVKSRYVHEDGQGILIVDVATDRIGGQVALDNSGSRELGPVRLDVRVDVNAVATDGDQLTLQLVSTPLDPRELAFASLRYAISVGLQGLQVGLAGAVGRTDPDYGDANIIGKSASTSVFANRPLIRARTFSLWATGELTYSHSDQRFEGYEFQRDNMLVVGAGLAATGVVGGGRLWSGLSIVQGVGIAGTTKAGDPFASRFDAGDRFAKLSAWLDWTRPINEQVSMRLAASGQLADRPLLAAQEIGLGGPMFGRAYDYSELSGDNGILGVLEFQQKFPNIVKGVDWIQSYEFIDGGYVANLRGAGQGSLVSIGAGLRARTGRLNLGVEAAFPVHSKRARTNDKSPRLNLSVGRDF